MNEKYSDNDFIRDIKAVPYLNAEIGLTNCLGRTSLFSVIIDRFIVETPDKLIKLKKELAKNKKEQSMKISHTIKGLCVQIGALEIAEKVSVLEKSLRKETPRIELDYQYNNLANSCINLIENLSTIKTSRDKVERISFYSAQELCKKLARKLKNHSMSALDLLESEKKSFNMILGDDYVWIREALITTNFYAAIDWFNESTRNLDLRD